VQVRDGRATVTGERAHEATAARLEGGGSGDEGVRRLPSPAHQRPGRAIPRRSPSQQAPVTAPAPAEGRGEALAALRHAPTTATRGCGVSRRRAVGRASRRRGAFPVSSSSPAVRGADEHGRAVSGDGRGRGARGPADRPARRLRLRHLCGSHAGERARGSGGGPRLDDRPGRESSWGRVARDVRPSGGEVGRRAGGGTALWFVSTARTLKPPDLQGKRAPGARERTRVPHSSFPRNGGVPGLSPGVGS